MPFIRGTGTVLKTIWNGYFDDKVPRLAAALAYYTVFSAAPLLVIAIALAGLVFGHEAASGQIAQQIEGLVGSVGAEAIEGMVASASRQDGGLLATAIGVAVLLFGATGVFGELQDSLNTIWGVKAKPGHSLWLFVRTRLLSFTMVLGVGFLLLVSLLLSALLAGIGAWLSHIWPSLSAAIDVGNVVLIFLLSTALFAMIYKLLPDVRLRWSDVWIGAAATAALFAIGRWAIGLYIGHSAISSSYGVAGSLAVFLIWVYFSAQAFLVGAEFTKAFATTYGSQVVPKPVAQWQESHERELQGLGPGTGPGSASGKRPSGRHDGSGRLAPG
jgi:membrane protein